jgi:5'-3' exonuclease
MAPLLIADVPWLLYRAFFSLPKSIVGADGEPVNALLGTVNALLGMLEARPSRAVVACTGAEDAAYRVKLYPGYHAQREEMPPELRSQWEQAPGLLESLGWTVATDEELEADDVMFSYALAETRDNGHALLLTGDRDLFGAVDQHVSVVLPGKDGGAPTEIGPAQVRERYGVSPAQVPDFIALRGDPSDGLPGAPGIGAKTAAELLGRYGTLEQVLAAARQAAEPRVRRDETAMRPRTAAALCENEELLGTFKRIATLVEIDGIVRPPDAVSDFARGALAAQDLGMKQLAVRLERMASAQS